jgi:FixJ family two-component response regulator
MKGWAPTVFVVDDDDAVRKALTRLLASAGHHVAAFDCAAAFMLQYDPERAGCLVLDMHMPGLNGIELQSRLAGEGSILPIVFLSGRGDIPSSVTAMKFGAVDFLTKPVDDDVLLAAVGQALDRNMELHIRRTQRVEAERCLATLTPRESEVLNHVVMGKRNKQIATELGTVEKTVKVHRARVMEKLQAKSLVDLVEIVRLAGSHGNGARTDEIPVQSALPPTGEDPARPGKGA